MNDFQKQLKFKLPTQSQKTAFQIFLLLTLILAIFPFWNSFQDLLTRTVIKLNWYGFISETIVPYELRIVGIVLTLIHLPVKVGNNFIEFTRPDKTHEAIYLIWNCVGWQSAVFLIITLITGLSRKYSLRSRLETVLLGILGTYLINILRLVLVIIVYYFFGRLIGSIFHEYIVTLFTLIWILFFWWLAYSFVLEEKVK